MLALFPMALSPTHPIAVYGYLASNYVPALMRPAHADTEDGLEDFLLSPEQVECYRKNLLADMANTRGGEVFAIVRNPKGALHYAPLRTWNQLLPARLPEALRAHLDRKEFPFLGDQVALWLEGHTLVAVGHYHAFGGAPSGGDRVAQSLASVPEIVVSNGIVPLVYFQGGLLPYANDVKVTPELFRSMRTLTPGLTMAVDPVSPIDREPSASLVAVLGQLRDHHDVDIANRQEVARALLERCRAFKRDYRFAFEEGYIPGPYNDKPDHAQMLRNITSIHAWAEMYALSPANGV